MNAHMQIAELHMLGLYLKAARDRIDASASSDQLLHPEAELYIRNTMVLLREVGYKRLFDWMNDDDKEIVVQTAKELELWFDPSTDKKLRHAWFKLTMTACLTYIKDKIKIHLEDLMRSTVFFGNRPVAEEPQEVKEPSIEEKVAEFLEQAQDHKYLVLKHNNSTQVYEIDHVCRTMDGGQPNVIAVRSVESDGKTANAITFFIAAVLLGSYEISFLDELPTGKINGEALSKAITSLGKTWDDAKMTSFMEELKHAMYVEMPSSDGLRLVWKKIRQIEGIEKGAHATVIHLSSFDPLDTRVDAYPLSSLPVPKLRLRAHAPVDENLLKKWGEFIEANTQADGNKVAVTVLKPTTQRFLHIMDASHPDAVNERSLGILDPITKTSLVCSLSDLILSGWVLPVEPK